MAHHLKRVFKHRMFTKYLLLTNMLISGGVDSLGDIVEQKLEHKDGITWIRTARMGAIGLVFGISDHFWYRLLDKHFPGIKICTICKKILLDMVVMGPPDIIVFYLAMCRLEGKSWRESIQELKEKFIITYQLELTIWPAAQLVNFYFFPPSWRVLFINIISLGWAVVLSKLKHEGPGGNGAIHTPPITCESGSNTCTTTDMDVKTKD